MPEELTAAEVRRHAGASDFSAAFVVPADDDASSSSSYVLSWVQSRGRIEKGAGDSGKDLVLMREGGFPRVLSRGAALNGGIAFSPSGRTFCYRTSDSLVRGTAEDPSAATTTTWVTLEPGESFCGGSGPVWIREEAVLFGVRGGNPRRDRLYVAPAIDADGVVGKSPGGGGRVGPLFTAQEGGTLIGWDHSQKEEDGRVALVHRLADAMVAEVVLLELGDEGEGGGGAADPTILAVDSRVEYCKPKAAFLADGKLLLRLNAPRHGLWLWSGGDGGGAGAGSLEPVDVMGDGARHGTYDVCSGSYGPLGAPEGFRLDPGRTRAVVAARRVGGEDVSYADELYLLDFGEEKQRRRHPGRIIGTVDGGCKLPVAVSDAEVIYHLRSPVESGDLYLTKLPGNENGTGTRLTETMPLSLKQKLVTPKEVMIRNEKAPFRDEGSDPLHVHALLFAPPGSSDERLQPLLWLHGGPMAQYSYDCNPLLSWLAGCGYLVLAPNFSGSTGNGLGHMERVLGDGCGVADLSDCLACAAWLRALDDPRLDLSRGIGVAGHSWGGYLAFLCMLESDDEGRSVFGCGVAAAGIADWSVQQRHTEVRYYDRALLGGWVYEDEVAARARAASPLTRASDLRAPLLVLHGDKDVDVPYPQIPPFVEAARRSTHPGAEVEFHAYPGEGHGMSGTAEVQADYLRRIRTFLRIHLKPWDFTSNPHGDVTAY